MHYLYFAFKHGITIRPHNVVVMHLTCLHSIHTQRPDIVSKLTGLHRIHTQRPDIVSKFTGLHSIHTQRPDIVSKKKHSHQNSPGKRKLSEVYPQAYRSIFFLVSVKKNVLLKNYSIKCGGRQM